MNIQASINQGISLAALLVSQSDFAKTQAEARRLGKEIKATKSVESESLTGIKTALEGAEQPMTGEELDMGDFADASIYNESVMRLANLQGRMASLKPSAKNVEAYSVAKSNARAAQERQDDPSSALYTLKNGGISMTRLQKQQQAASAAQDAGAAEAERLAASNMLDLSKLDARTVDRVNRAYKKAEHDSYYLNKNNPIGGNK